MRMVEDETRGSHKEDHDHNAHACCESFVDSR
jgi:hypothetical protein